MSDRRGFLRGLATLPLIGGSVALIGSPTGAAVPASIDMLKNYEGWLAWERFRLQREIWGDEAAAKYTTFLSCRGSAFGWHNPVRGDPQCPEPSTRAAVILAAAGVPLAGGTR